MSLLSLFIHHCLGFAFEGALNPTRSFHLDDLLGMNFYLSSENFIYAYSEF